MNDVCTICLTGKLSPHQGAGEWETFPLDSHCVDKAQMIEEFAKQTIG